MQTVQSPDFPLPNDPKETSKSNAGFLYVMRSPLMDGDIYKIGFTVKNPRSELTAALCCLARVFAASIITVDASMPETLAPHSAKSDRKLSVAAAYIEYSAAAYIANELADQLAFEPLGGGRRSQRRAIGHKLRA